jgi:DNA-directed RNA polymerase specialized sigma24 family protein
MMPTEDSLALVLEFVAVAVGRWRIPPGLERTDLVQEALSRWLRLPESAAGIAVADRARSLVGIARNVRREWWRAVARQRRLLDELGSLPVARVGEAVVDHDVDLRAAAVSKVATFLAREDAEALFMVRWDGFSWRDAFAAVGVVGEALVVARRKRILRILSTERVQKSLVEWKERSGLPFPSLPRNS